jgi:hypothetical protein
LPDLIRQSMQRRRPFRIPYWLSKLHLCMDHRVKPGGDEKSEMAWRNGRSEERNNEAPPLAFLFRPGLRASRDRFCIARARSRAARTRAFILHRDSGGGGPREAWWRGRVTRRFVFTAGQSSRSAPLPPRYATADAMRRRALSKRTAAEGRLCPPPHCRGAG